MLKAYESSDLVHVMAYMIEPIEKDVGHDSYPLVELRTLASLNFMPYYARTIPSS